MLTVPTLRFRLVKLKGPLHVRLQNLLHEAWVAKTITQESLAKAIGNSQENTGQYLRRGKAGALDLDQADAALRHIGSSLTSFLQQAPARELTDAERIGQMVDQRPGLRRVVELLLSVPKTRLDAVAELIRTVVLPATVGGAIEIDALPTEPKKARRTTKGSKKRR